MIIKNQKADPIFAKFIQYSDTQWPKKHILLPELGPDWPERENLTMVGELLLRGQKIMIPHWMRDEFSTAYTKGHCQGSVKCVSLFGR